MTSVHFLFGAFSISLIKAYVNFKIKYKGTPMLKPFDFSDLGQRFKDGGLPAVEQDAKLVTTILIGWLEDSVAAEPNPMFKVAIPVLEFLKPLALAAEDKIDGITGD